MAVCLNVWLDGLRHTTLYAEAHPTTHFVNVTKPFSECRKIRKAESTTSSDSSSDSSDDYWRWKVKKLKKKLRKKRGRKYRQGISVSSYDSY